MRALLGGLVLALMASAASWTAAFSADAPKMFPEIQAIADRGSIRVAVLSSDLPPMITADEDGQPEGFDVRLVEEIARALGVDPEYVETSSTQGDLLDTVARGDADIGVSYLSQTVSAGRFVYFTDPYLVQDFTLLINRVKGAQYARHCPSRNDLLRILDEPDQIGVLDFSLYEDFLKRLYPSGKPKPFATFAEMTSAAQEGTIFASIQGEIAAKYFLSRHPEAALRLKVCAAGPQQDRIAIAVRPDAPDLLRWLNLFISNRAVVVDAETVIYQEDAGAF